jgi:uncharacterized membrane protein
MTSTRPNPERVRRVEILISTLLRVGVVTSLTVVVLGTLLSFVHHPDYVSSKAELSRLTKPGAAFPHTISEVIEGVRRLQGRAVVMAGLMLLIGTPVLRVAVSIIAFVYEGDWIFMVITSIVLALLLLSFVLGRAGG